MKDLIKRLYGDRVKFGWVGTDESMWFAHISLESNIWYENVDRSHNQLHEIALACSNKFQGYLMGLNEYGETFNFAAQNITHLIHVAEAGFKSYDIIKLTIIPSWEHIKK
jgi:hypothetical protein